MELYIPPKLSIKKSPDLFSFQNTVAAAPPMTPKPAINNDPCFITIRKLADVFILHRSFILTKHSLKIKNGL